MTSKAKPEPTVPTFERFVDECQLAVSAGDFSRETFRSIVHRAVADGFLWSLNKWRSLEGAPIREFWAEMERAEQSLRSCNP